MASVSQQVPTTPRQAARRRATVDRRLDTQLFRALGDPTRAQLLACLVKCGRPCSVSEVAECCAVDFSVVARHLALLARAGVLSANKEGRTVWYQARCTELSSKLRALADAIDEWCPATRACRTNRTADAASAACCRPRTSRRKDHP
ncbi:MAG: winged helix-turn-helix transcriptional regulator [Phycisphaerales bacterium]|nr:winged helix-turn-helix transcriptional regulator [Phycisphaerales bacterium]